jgi:hypothetical protein
MEDVCQGSVRVMHSQKRAALDPAVERELATGNEPLGTPWKDYRFSGKEGQSMFSSSRTLLSVLRARQSGPSMTLVKREEYCPVQVKVRVFRSAVTVNLLRETI